MAKVILITGASRGIGRALSIKLLMEGHFVIGVARNEDALKSIQSEFPNFYFIAGDLTETQTIDKIVSFLLDSFQKLDCIILNAGILVIDQICSIELQQIIQTFQLTLFSSINLIQKLMNRLRDSNALVLSISSGAAVSAFSGWSAYCTSKAAMNMFIKCLAVEESKITAISIAPGIVDTEMQNQIRNANYDQMPASSIEYFSDLHKSGMLKTVEHCAEEIVEYVREYPVDRSGDFIDLN